MMNLSEPRRIGGGGKRQERSKDEARQTTVTRANGGGLPKDAFSGILAAAHMERTMKLGWGRLAVAALIVTSDASVARSRHHGRAHPAPTACVDRPVTFSWGKLFWDPGPPPGPNGCAPPVYFGGSYIGQDPDPFIRSQLLRDPRTGASVNYR